MEIKVTKGEIEDIVLEYVRKKYKSPTKMIFWTWRELLNESDFHIVLRTKEGNKKPSKLK